jgi:hypothetical protein
MLAILDDQLPIIRPARRPPALWVDTMFILYDTPGRYFLDEI